MKRLAQVLAMAVVAVGGLAAAAFATGGHDPVIVCHKPGTPAQHSLEIDKSALYAHLAHGDYKGACPGQTTTVTTPGQTTTVTLPAQTVTVTTPGPTQTVTLPAVTLPAQTVTNTVTVASPPKVVTKTRVVTKVKWRTKVKVVTKTKVIKCKPNGACPKGYRKWKGKCYPIAHGSG